MLGLAHHHDGDDLVITEGWEALLDGLGYSLKGNAPMKNRVQILFSLIESANWRSAAVTLSEERSRKRELEKERSTVPNRCRN